MAIKRFSKSFKQRDDILGQVTPNPFKQDNTDAPFGDWKPAAWLPVQFEKTEAMQGTDAFVISKGKVVALDSQGRVVPAGMRLKLKSGAGALVYTAVDAAYGVIDLVTGVEVAGPVSYTSVQAANGILERGLVSRGDVIATGGSAIPASTQNHADIVIDLFIQGPVGIAAYDMYVWSGLPEDGDQKFLNYSKQHAVQFVTERQLQLPVLSAGATAANAFVVATLNTAGSATAAVGDVVAPREYWSAAQVSQLTRYSLMGVTASSPVVALGLDPAGSAAHFRVAADTDRTPFECATAGVLVRKRLSPADISQAGDWYLDADAGVLFLSSATWAAGVTAVATWNFSYNYYLVSPAVAHKHVHFDGPVRPGMRVTYDAQSNFVGATSSTAEADIVGRALQVFVHPTGLLQHVKTGFTGSTSATSQMPGSATKGFPDNITLSDEIVADQMVTVNVRL